MMERITYSYSLKNIPIPPTDSYLKSFIRKVESLLKCMRWKAFFFDKDKENNNNITETYGFNTEKTAPPKPSLIPIENDIYSWIERNKILKTPSDISYIII